MTRSALKSIVKECLVEILAEGLESSSMNSSTSALVQNKKRNTTKKRAELQRLKEHRQSLETRVSSTVSAATEDPIMQSMLQQTAMTTLQEQLSNEMPGQGESSLAAMNESVSPTGEAAGINLDSIFSSPKANWAELAFTDKKSS